MTKVCPIKEGNVAISTVVGEQKFTQSKLDKEAKPIYNNFTYGYGYTGSAEFLCHSSNYFLYYHNKQDISGHESKENLLTFSDQDNEPHLDKRINRIYPSMSGVVLKNVKF